MALRARRVGAGRVRYLNIDLEKSNRRDSFNADIEMFGPFLGVNLYF